MRPHVGFAPLHHKKPLAVGSARRFPAPHAVATIAATDVLAAMRPVLESMAEVVRRAWSRLPDEDACQAIESGICLTGGGATLRSLVEAIARRTRIDVRVPPRPTHAVIAGAGRMAF